MSSEFLTLRIRWRHTVDDSDSDSYVTPLTAETDPDSPSRTSNMSICSDCGGTVIEYDHAAGNGFCVSCGTVVEENTIVSELGFDETSAGAAVVQGSFVAQGSTRAHLTGPLGHRANHESREQTIANANKKIQSIANILRLSEQICLAATRLYTLAVEHKFTKGRKSLNVVAVCLYVACRQKETRNYMLIDFSDLLQVNVFELGHTYLQLVQTLNLRLPLVDPSHYISRFAALLEFGEETNRVATDAVRLVSRFDRDWMSRGRRPAGICGAALLLAARMNNFRRSVEEIVQVVKIADTTLKKRLDEFRKTPSGQLTLADFRRVWLDEEMDPPAFTKGREKEEAEKRAAEESQQESPNGGEGGRKMKMKDKTTPKKKRKRKRIDSDEETEEVESTPHPPPQPLFDPALLHQGILAGTMESMPAGVNHMPLFAPDPDEEVNSHIDPALLQQSVQYRTAPQQYTESESLHAPLDINIELGEPDGPQQASDYVDTTMENVIVEEVSKYLGEGRAAQVRAVLEEQEEQERQRRIEREEERRKRASAWREQQYSLTNGAFNGPVSAVSQVEEEEEEDWTLGLNDEELDKFLLDEEEAKIKERVWVELNKDYLEALAGGYLFKPGIGNEVRFRIWSDPSTGPEYGVFAKRIILAKGEQQDATTAAKSRKRRKTAKPRDATTPSGATVTESVQNLVKKNLKYSRRINYNALKELFVDSGGLPSLAETMTTGMDEKDDTELIQMEDGKGDTEPQLIVEEGTVGVVSAVSTGAASDARKRAYDDEDGEGESDDEKDEPMNYAWEDAYEQEI
ncbi:BRF1-domain-containing protein [Amanita rubescens]|nr:BRF1-domain-containing protein [Amanita rubescens]